VTAIGALIMAVVLILSGAPTALVVGAVLAALPVGPLLWCFLWLDRYEPEPRHLLAMALGWGAFVATSGALILQLIDQGVFAPSELIAASVVAPVTEEAAKGAFILLLFWFRRHELDGVLDGIVYAGMIGIGFAFSENILYLSSAYVGDEDLAGGFGSAVTVFVLRGIFSPFAHPFFTAFTGIGIGLAVTTRRSEIRILAPLVGFGLAVLSPRAVEWILERRRQVRLVGLCGPDGPCLFDDGRLCHLGQQERRRNAHHSLGRLCAERFSAKC
jgi:RsiW-degrading membrane proteinase PrsW (M82 family)